MSWIARYSCYFCKLNLNSFLEVLYISGYKQCPTAIVMILLRHSIWYMGTYKKWVYCPSITTETQRTSTHLSVQYTMSREQTRTTSSTLHSKSTATFQSILRNTVVLQTSIWLPWYPPYKLSPTWFSSLIANITNTSSAAIIAFIGNIDHPTIGNIGHSIITVIIRDRSLDCLSYLHL